MFSLHKNYIKEQQKLIHQLQEQIITQNVRLKELAMCFEYKQQIIPFFKKIAQILAYYCTDNVTVRGCPNGSTAANIMLYILDNLEEEMTDDSVNEIETKIRNWEADIIEKSNAEHYDLDKAVNNGPGKPPVIPQETKKSVESEISGDLHAPISEISGDLHAPIIETPPFVIEHSDESILNQGEDTSLADDVLDSLVSQMKEDDVFTGAFDNEPEIIVSEDGKIVAAPKPSTDSVEATLDQIELELPKPVEDKPELTQDMQLEAIPPKEENPAKAKELSDQEKVVANFGGLLLVESD